MQTGEDKPLVLTEQELIKSAKLTEQPAILRSKDGAQTDENGTYFVNEEFLIATAVLSENARKGRKSTSVSSKSTEGSTVDDVDQDSAENNDDSTEQDQTVIERDITTQTISESEEHERKRSNIETEVDDSNDEKDETNGTAAKSVDGETEDYEEKEKDETEKNVSGNDENDKQTNEMENVKAEEPRRDSEKDSIEDEVFAHEKVSTDSHEKSEFMNQTEKDTENTERKDEFLGQTVEEILIAQAELAASELGRSTRSYQEETFRVNDERGRQLSPIPRLEIHTVDDSGSNNDEDDDGYKTPVNSDMTDEPMEGSRQIVQGKVNHLESRSPYRPKASDKKPTTQLSAPSAKLWRGKAEDKATDSDFYRLIIEIANEMSERDFEEVRSMFRDTCDLNPFVLKSLDSPFTLLNWLRCQRMISRDNMHHLQVILKRLGNPLLITRANQYVRHHCDVIHFYPEPETVPDNYGTLRCQIGGKDFTRLRRKDLELVRFTVSALVFLPVQHVYVVGIEPGLLVTVLTLMLPERYRLSLKDAVARGSESLAQASIDSVEIDGLVYSAGGKDGNVTASSGDHKQFLTIYQQLREKTESLEERNAEVTRLKREAEWTQLELETMSAELELLTERAVIETRDRFDSRRRSGNKVLKSPQSLEPVEAEINRFPSIQAAVKEASAKPARKAEPTFKDLEGAAISGVKVEQKSQQSTSSDGKRRISAELESVDREMEGRRDVRQPPRKHASVGESRSELLGDIQDILHELKSTKLF